jgi:hypothetical protein
MTRATEKHDETRDDVVAVTLRSLVHSVARLEKVARGQVDPHSYADWYETGRDEEDEQDSDR